MYWLANRPVSAAAYSTAGESNRAVRPVQCPEATTGRAGHGPARADRAAAASRAPACPAREQGCHITPFAIVRNGMRTRSGSALLGVVIGAGPAGLAAGPPLTGEPGAAGMLWLWTLVADGGWPAREG